MHERLTGTLIMLGFAYFLFVGARGLSLDLESVQAVAEQSRLYGLALDPADWLLHWRVRSVAVASLSAVGLVGGAAMFCRKRWSWSVIAVAATTAVLLDLFAWSASLHRYAFENPRLIPHLTLIALAIVAVVARRKRNGDPTNARNA